MKTNGSAYTDPSGNDDPARIEVPSERSESRELSWVARGKNSACGALAVARRKVSFRETPPDKMGTLTWK